MGRKPFTVEQIRQGIELSTMSIDQVVATHLLNERLDTLQHFSAVLEHPEQLPAGIEAREIQGLEKAVSDRINALMNAGARPIAGPISRGYRSQAIERPDTVQFLDILSPKQRALLNERLGEANVTAHVDDPAFFDGQCVGVIANASTPSKKKVTAVLFTYFATKGPAPKLIDLQFVKSAAASRAKTREGARANCSIAFDIIDAKNTNNVTEWTIDYPGNLPPTTTGILWDEHEAKGIASVEGPSQTYTFLPRKIEEVICRRSGLILPEKAADDMSALDRLARMQGGEEFTQAMREIDWAMNLKKFAESPDLETLLRANERETERIGILIRESREVWSSTGGLRGSSRRKL